MPQGLKPKPQEFRYELEEYVQYRFLKVFGVNLTLLCRFLAFGIAFTVWVGGVYFNYQGDSYTYLGYIELWGATLAMVHFLFLFIVTSSYRKCRKLDMPYTKKTTLTIVEYWSFATVCAAVTAFAFYYAYQEGKLDEYGFADPSLGGGDTESEPSTGETNPETPSGEEASGDDEVTCANCVLGYDLGPFQETVSIGNHTYVPVLVVVEFLLGRVPVSLWHFTSIVVVVGAYCAANYYIVKNVNDGEPIWPGVLTWSGEDGDETPNQIGFIAGLFVAVGVVQFILRRFLMASIVDHESEDDKKKGTPKAQGRRPDDYYYEDDYHYGKGKGKGKGKGQGHPHHYNNFHYV